MPAVAMCSMKGGTGKTTIGFNLSERAFSSGLDVVLLDFDPPGGFPGHCRPAPGGSVPGLLAGSAGAGSRLRTPSVSPA